MAMPFLNILKLGVVYSLTGCALYRSGAVEETDSVVAAVVQGWEDRLYLDDLRDSIEIGRSSSYFMRNEPGMLWWVARELNALAYGHDPIDSMELYELAYEICFRCLGSNAGWQGRLDNSGGAVTVAAVDRLTEREVPCLEELVYAWVRLIEGRGAHSHIDIPELAYFVDRLLALSPDRWVGYWANGMITSFQGGNLSEIEAYMDLAYEQEPSLATSTSDYLKITRNYEEAELSESPSEKFRAREFMVNDGHVWALENQRAVRSLFEQ